MYYWFATAKDENGWFHIDLNGNELYKERYLIVEPFYNGFALVTDFSNNKMIINEKGGKILDVWNHHKKQKISEIVPLIEALAGPSIMRQRYFFKKKG